MTYSIIKTFDNSKACNNCGALMIAFNEGHIPDENSLTIKAFLISQKCDSLKKVKEID
jgi:hypothetical protein